MLFLSCCSFMGVRGEFHNGEILCAHSDSESHPNPKLTWTDPSPVKI